MDCPEWTMMVSVAGRMIGELSSRKRHSPFIGQIISVYRGKNPAGVVRNGRYQVIQVDEKERNFVAVPIGRLAQSFMAKRG